MDKEAATGRGCGVRRSRNTMGYNVHVQIEALVCGELLRGDTRGRHLLWGCPRWITANHSPDNDTLRFTEIQRPFSYLR